MPSRWCGNGVQAEDELLMAVDVIVQRDGSRKSVGGQIKLSLVFLVMPFLILVATACSGSPDAQKESRSSIEGNSILSKVALEVSTIT